MQLYIFSLTVSTKCHSLMTFSNKQKRLSLSTVIYPVNEIVNFLPIYFVFMLLYNMYVIICIHLHPLCVKRGKKIVSWITVLILIWKTDLSCHEWNRYAKGGSGQFVLNFFSVNRERIHTSSDKRECKDTWKVWISDLLRSVRDYPVTRIQWTTDYSEICVKCCIFIFEIRSL